MRTHESSCSWLIWIWCWPWPNWASKLPSIPATKRKWCNQDNMHDSSTKVIYALQAFKFPVLVIFTLHFLCRFLSVMFPVAETNCDSSE
jgi:hypothetical protein